MVSKTEIHVVNDLILVNIIFSHILVTHYISRNIMQFQWSGDVSLLLYFKTTLFVIITIFGGQFCDCPGLDVCSFQNQTFLKLSSSNRFKPQFARIADQPCIVYKTG